MGWHYCKRLSALLCKCPQAGVVSNRLGPWSDARKASSSFSQIPLTAVVVSSDRDAGPDAASLSLFYDYDMLAKKFTAVGSAGS
jgi:hypothetical protein